MNADFTPMMRQYLDIKERHKDAILFFRLGDFYEMFFDDAVEAAQILHIVLTSRGTIKGMKVPMCGVPYHAADNYIARLIKHGKKVAICEQVEAPSPGKKIVERQITRIITPGTFTGDTLLDEAVNNYILSLNEKNGIFGLAYADISTGEFRVTEVKDKEDLFSEVYKISPSECLLPEQMSKDNAFQQFKDINLGVLTLGDDWMFDYEVSVRELKAHFSVKSLEGFGCEELYVGVGAAGALLKYLKNTQKSRLNNLNISGYYPTQFMFMDRNSHRHLELIQNHEDFSVKGTLFEVLDMTKTPMGRRKLKNWILNPLLDIKKIEERLDAVQYFCDTYIRNDVRGILGEVYDIERLSSKIGLGTANARDLNVLAFSLDKLKLLCDKLKDARAEAVKDIILRIADFSAVIKDIKDCIVDAPPHTLKEGGLIREGYDAEADEVRRITKDAKDWVLELQRKEIERTGINSLKVGYNKIFGYYIEVTNANLNAVPSEYVRKQTLVNAERYITDELKREEAKIIGAEERIKDMEYDIFCRLREKISGEMENFKKAAEGTAELDVLSNLAEAAVRNKYTRPRFAQDAKIYIKEGRHPVLEKILKDKEFVPNDVCLDREDNRIFIITGSNMAGKSTFIRQVALITIMAQMGGFVPAEKAEIEIVDRIFTRVGASDRLYRGMSTFMVEMLETANILNNATNRSLIILDEVGRGTSTFDGVSIAWAVVEYIHQKIPGAKTMFATHYHELTELAAILKGVKNYHLAVRSWKDDIVFLYRVTQGSCDDSFGIHVAKLAGMPQEVIKRAREILNNLQKDSLLGNTRSRFSKERTPDLFEETHNEHPLIKRINELDPDTLTPLEALKKITEFKNSLKDSAEF